MAGPHLQVPGARSVRDQVQDKIAQEAWEKRNVILDVGGERFIATREILSVFPATRFNFRFVDIIMTNIFS